MSENLGALVKKHKLALVAGASLAVVAFAIASRTPAQATGPGTNNSAAYALMNTEAGYQASLSANSMKTQAAVSIAALQTETTLANILSDQKVKLAQVAAGVTTNKANNDTALAVQASKTAATIAIAPQLANSAYALAALQGQNALAVAQANSSPANSAVNNQFLLSLLGAGAKLAPSILGGIGQFFGSGSGGLTDLSSLGSSGDFIGGLGLGGSVPTDILSGNDFLSALGF